MSMTLSLAIAAVAGFGLAAALPRRSTLLLAGVLALVAACARVHGAGAGVVALVAGAAIAFARADSETDHRPAAVFGLVVSAAALLAAPPAPALHTAPLLLALAAPIVAALALAAALRDPNARHPLALVLALLPFPAAAVAPAHAELAVTFDGAAGAWAMRRGLAFDSSHWPAWADAIWSTGPWLLLVVVLVAYVRPKRNVQLGAAAAVGVALLVAAMAQVMGALDAPHVVRAAAVGLTGDAMPIRATVALDGSVGISVLLRFVAILVLLQPSTPTTASTASSLGPVVTLSPIAALAAFITLGLAALVAPAWYGIGWMADPGVSSLLLVGLLGSVLSVAASNLGSRATGLMHAGLGLAALLLVGGGELGWRVAGVVLGR